jgi:predicted transcriptional regulator
MLNREEKQLARAMFRPLIFQADAQAFEDLFVRVMQHHNSNFRPVKPQGRKGDGGNDGYDDTTGTYYQVYGPEDLSNSVEKAVTKLNDNFQRLYQEWQKSTPIQHYYFVVNDKYKGTYPDIEKAIAALRQLYGEITFDIMLAKGIEDIFMGLAEDAVIDIIGNIPEPMKIGLSDYAVMNEVIRHIMNYEGTKVQENYEWEPDFNKKLDFNGLSRRVAVLLEAGRRDSYIIEEYFKRNSEYKKNEIQDRFKTLYEQAKSEIQDSLAEHLNTPDLIFFQIVSKASPDQRHAIKNAVYVLMAYYFEACDIYEEPTT